MIKKIINWLKNTFKESKSAYQAGREGSFEICQLNSSNALEICRGLSKSIRSQRDGEKFKKKIEALLDRYYAEPTSFPDKKEVEFIEIIKEFENFIGWAVDEDDIEDVLLNIHLFSARYILKKEEDIFNTLEELKETTLIIIIEKIAKWWVKEKKDPINKDINPQLEEFFINIYNICSDLKKWQYIAPFSFAGLKELPEELKREIALSEDTDNYKYIQEFIEEREESEDKNFYLKYKLDIDTLLAWSGAIAAHQNASAITLEIVSSATKILHLKTSNKKIIFLFKLIEPEETKDTKNIKHQKEEIEKHLGSNSKLKIDDKVKVFEKLLEKYWEDQEDSWLFTYEKSDSEPTDKEIDKPSEYFEVIKDFAGELYEKKMYQIALGYFDKLYGKKDDDTKFKILVCAAKSGKLMEKYKDLYDTYVKEEILKTKCKEIQKFEFEKHVNDEFYKYFFMPCEEIKLKEELENLINGKYHILFYLAKHFAIREKKSEITKEDIRNASTYLVLEEEAKKIFERHELEEVKEKRIIEDGEILQALKASKLNFSEKAKKILASFKENDESDYFKLYGDMTGKDVLLLAKYFAIEQKNEEITLDNLRKAVGSFDITNGDLQKLSIKGGLDRVLDVDIFKSIASIKNEAKKNFQEELKEDPIFKWLKENIDTRVGKARI